MEKNRCKKMLFHLFVVVWVMLGPAANLNGQVKQVEAVTIPVSGNTWQRPNETRELDRTAGILGGEQGSLFDTYIRFKEKGAIQIALQLGPVPETSTLRLTVNGKERRFTVTPALTDQLVSAGVFHVTDTGYAQITLASVQGKMPAVRSYQIEGGRTILDGLQFVRNNEDNYYYWGRRGPSVHLSYTVPSGTDIEYYYNELTVPEGEDVIGSYFMANGFAQGYFGIQVNSEQERRILFSVWSPFHTDNPQEIPDDQKIVLTKKGRGVSTGEFGNEGAGGQSFLRYSWKAGHTYRFLLKGKPVQDNYTEFTAWFYAPEEREWRLIAQFLRPKTSTFLKGFHSFLENFIPSQGNQERQVLFGNQWVRTASGQWLECVDARFTADATARKDFRLDYAGGEKNGFFFLRNGGFFSDYTPIGSAFSRKATKKLPDVDLEKMPVE